MASDIGPAIVNAADRMDAVLNSARFAIIRVEVNASGPFFLISGMSNEPTHCKSIEWAVNVLHSNGFCRLEESEENGWIELMEMEKERLEEMRDGSAWQPVVAVFIRKLSREETGCSGQERPLENGALALADSIIDAAVKLNRPYRRLPCIVSISLNFDRTVSGDLYQVRGLGDETKWFKNFVDALNVVSSAGFCRLEKEDEERWKLLVSTAVSVEGYIQYESGEVVCVLSK